MKQEMVTISKKEYRRLKQAEKKENDLLRQIAESLEDIKEGRVVKVN